MQHVFRHDLEPALAHLAIEKALESYSAQFADYNPRLTWLDTDTAEVTFSALKTTVRAVFTLKPGEINVEMKVPLLMRPFRKKAIEVIGDEIKEWIRKARCGELEETTAGEGR